MAVHKAIIDATHMACIEYIASSQSNIFRPVFGNPFCKAYQENYICMHKLLA